MKLVVKLSRNLIYHWYTTPKAYTQAVCARLFLNATLPNLFSCGFNARHYQWRTHAFSAV